MNFKISKLIFMHSKKIRPKEKTKNNLLFIFFIVVIHEWPSIAPDVCRVHVYDACVH